MAPHPVVQAVIDLSAGAVGKLHYLHFHFIIIQTLVVMLSTYPHFFCLTSQHQMAPACHLAFDDSVLFPLHLFQFLLTLAGVYHYFSYTKGFL